MPSDILLVTTPPSFGELIQETLKETGGHRVVFVSNGFEAIDHARSASFSLAILDADIEDSRLSDLMEQLKRTTPGMRFIVIPRDNRTDAQEAFRFPIEGYLMKPFYLPDLVEMVSRALREDHQASTDLQADPDAADPFLNPGQKNPTWSDDPVYASQLLTQLSLVSAAEGIMIMRGDKLWASAGQLTQPEAQEVGRLVAHYWLPSAGRSQGKKGDLTRFVRLGASGGEFVLFATALQGGMVLALVAEIETPFSQIRSLAYEMAKYLDSPTGDFRNPNDLSAVQSASAAGSSRRSADESGSEPLPMQPLLDDIPSPKPVMRSGSSEPFKSGGQDKPRVDDPAQLNLVYPPVPEKQPAVAAMVTAQEQATSPVVHDLSYFCLLLPRMPHHQLIGDLAERLSEWVGQLCMAYGWRLEHLSISPEKLQWIVRAAPTVPPAEMVDTLRRQTSERIFEHFAMIRQENPSGDFWAPGYLIMTEISSVSDSMIQDFIQKVRQYQGAASIVPSRLRR